MNRHKFSLLKDRIVNADKQDPLWWTGGLFLDLTSKQMDAIIDLIANMEESRVYNPCYMPICAVYYNGDVPFRVELPSGLILRRYHK